MSIFKKLKEILSNLDNERLAIGAGTILGSIFLVSLIFVPGFLESEWFLDLLIFPAQFAGILAIVAYIGRFFNLLTSRAFGRKTKVSTVFNSEAVMSRRIGPQEKIFTPIGMLLGLALGIACICLSVTVPFINVFSYFAYILFILSFVCVFGGLFNRLGSCIDGTRLKQEKKAIILGIVLGLLFSLSIIAILSVTGTLPIASIVGISKAFIDVFCLNKILFSYVFVASVTSITTSFFDYLSKAYCFLKYKGLLGAKDEVVDERLSARKHEYRGAFIGSLVGFFFITPIIIATLPATIFAGPVLVPLCTIVIILTSCTSIMGGLFLRIGRVLDGIARPCDAGKQVPTTELEISTPPAQNNINPPVSTPIPTPGQNTRGTAFFPGEHYLSKSVPCLLKRPPPDHRRNDFSRSI